MRGFEPLSEKCGEEAGGLDGDKLVPPSLRIFLTTAQEEIWLPLHRILYHIFGCLWGEKVKKSLSVNDVSMGVKNAADTFSKVCILSQKCDFGHFIVYDF